MLLQGCLIAVGSGDPPFSMQLDMDLSLRWCLRGDCTRSPLPTLLHPNSNGVNPTAGSPCLPSPLLPGPCIPLWSPVPPFPFPLAIPRGDERLACREPAHLAQRCDLSCSRHINILHVSSAAAASGGPIAAAPRITGMGNGCGSRITLGECSMQARSCSMCAAEARPWGVMGAACVGMGIVGAMVLQPPSTLPPGSRWGPGCGMEGGFRRGAALPTSQTGFSPHAGTFSAVSSEGNWFPLPVQDGAPTPQCSRPCQGVGAKLGTVGAHKGGCAVMGGCSPSAHFFPPF